MTFVDATVVNVALPALQTDLHATITDVQWVIEAYALFLGALILVGGSFGDQFGRKRVFLAGVVSFTAASVLCGVATSPAALIAGRALQGIGAAFLVPGSLAIISATFGDADRGRAIGTWSGFSSITAAIGPVLGGWLIEHVSWRAAFFLNVPLAAVVVALSLRFIDESRDTSRTARVDWSGAALAVLGLGGVVFGLLEWPPLGAGHPLVLGPLIAGAVSLGLFLAGRGRAAEPDDAARPVPVANLHAGEPPHAAAVRRARRRPVPGAAEPDSGAALHGHRGRRRAAAASGDHVRAVAMVGRPGRAHRQPAAADRSGPRSLRSAWRCCARRAIGGSYWTTFFPAVVVLGLGMAVTVAPLTTTVMGAVDPRHAGVASGVNNAVSRVAGLLAIAVFGVVLTNVFMARAEPALDAAGLSAPARMAVERELPKMAGADLDTAAPIERRERDAARQVIDLSFVAAFRVVMLAAATLAMLAAVSGAAIRGTADS